MFVAKLNELKALAVMNVLLLKWKLDCQFIHTFYYARKTLLCVIAKQV